MSLRYEVLGSYRVTARSGLCTGIAAAGALFVARWSHATNFCRVRSLAVSHLVTTGYTAAQEVGYQIVRGTAWSAAPSTGTALVPVKLLSTYPASLFAAADIRVSTTAALTKGTVVEDTELLGGGAVHALAATAGGAIAPNPLPLTDASLGGLVLTTNEGLLIENAVAQGAAGVGRWWIDFQFDELIPIGN